MGRFAVLALRVEHLLSRLLAALVLSCARGFASAGEHDDRLA